MRAETDTHEGPSTDAPDRDPPAFVVAFPAPRALPPPPSNEPVGRDWLLAHGVVDGEVSGRQLMVSRPGGVPSIEDAGSRNGTWLDGERLQPGDRVAISDGAVVRIGSTLLVYRDELPGGFAPAPPVGELVGPYGLRRVAAALEAFSRVPPANVLIEGETGTGKELAARAVAAALGRARQYCPVNVAGVPAGVFESQLFGYVAGAYSGSGRGSPGVIAAHQGGSVFLDEIGELPLELQPKLLRLLENREILPVGATRPVHADVLIVAATNRSLEDMVEQGSFRRDLLARLESGRIELPPLRERREDLFPIMAVLSARRGIQLDAGVAEVEAVERLLLHAWPANVRELATTLDRIAALEPLPRLRLVTVERVLGAHPTSARTGQLTPMSVERALAACAGNETQAARQLGVTRGKLRRFLAPRR